MTSCENQITFQCHARKHHHPQHNRELKQRRRKRQRKRHPKIYLYLICATSRLLQLAQLRSILYQDPIVYFSLIQLKPRGVSIWIFVQNPLSTFRGSCISAIPSSCSLHEKLQSLCGSSGEEESFVLLSAECNSNISANLERCHL